MGSLKQSLAKCKLIITYFIGYKYAHYRTYAAEKYAPKAKITAVI